MEYFEGEDLFDFVHAVSTGGEGLGEEAGRFILGQILSALQYIHRRGIVHQDIKMENIMIDKELNIKLFDFGFAQAQNIDKIEYI